MSQFNQYPDNNPYAYRGPAAQAPANTRAEFIRKTYLHLAGAILAFVLIEAAVFQLVDVASLTRTMLTGRLGWLVVLGLFMGVSWVANQWASSDTSKPMQYLGLSLYVVAEAILFVPMLFIASRLSDPDIIPTAALLTMMVFLGLTAVAFVTRADFSFLRGILMIAGFAAIGTIVAAAIFGFTLGILFTSLMIVFAGGYILYDTSNVLHHYRTDQHVAASLALFASVALLFWYVLRLLMSLNRR
ncbi:MAG: Bax inhibitor-1/YccA family protein [Phycisphaerales bacterium]